MKNRWKRGTRILALLLVAAMTASLASTCSLAAGSDKSAGSSSSNEQRKYFERLAASKKTTPPPEAGYVGIVIRGGLNLGSDMIFNPTGTLTGKGVDSSVEYLGNQLTLAHGNAIFQNTVPKSEKAARTIAMLNTKRRNLERTLEAARAGSRQYNATARAIERNVNKVGQQMMVTTQGARRASYVKNLGRGVNFLGTAFNGISIYSDLNTLSTGGYTHKHSSMIFISDALMSSSVFISSIAMTPLGKNPLVMSASLITGLVKDAVTSDTFSRFMNNRNNVVIRGADWTIDQMNAAVTSPTATYIPESLILRWYRFTGTMPSDEQLAEAEARHQKWLQYTQTPEYQAKIKRMQMGLGRKPGDGVGAYKPNIYLYPVNDTQVVVTFAMPSLLTRVIPDYEDAWRVTALPDGTLVNADGSTERFLFYESLTWPWLYQSDEGWMLKAETREAQLRGVMQAYGFTEAETEDFVSYWTLKLDVGADYAMYPQLTDTVDLAMPISISPAPDSLFRLWFTFEKGGVPAVEPQIAAFPRTGFAAVEWGGVILTNAVLK